MTLDEKLDTVEAFHAEFKALVRKYVPEYPQPNVLRSSDQQDILVMMQDKTSVYNPYIWSD